MADVYGFINAAFVQMFHDNIIMALQQKGSRLKNIVMLDTLIGTQGFYDVLEKDDAITTLADNFTSTATMHVPTAITDPQWDVRSVTASYLTKAYLIEQKDKIRLLADPTSRYVQNIAYAMGRQIDRIIMNAALGTAYTGPQGVNSVTLPTTQVIPVGYGVVGGNPIGSGSLSFNKLLYAKEILDAANVDPEEPRYIILPASQVFHLLSDLTATNLTRDAETVRAIAEGGLLTYMGFNFIMTNLTPTESYAFPAWSASTAVTVGEYIQPTSANANGYYYQCITAGNTGSTEPTWANVETLGQTVTDGTATWICYNSLANAIDDVVVTTKEGVLFVYNQETAARIDPRPDMNYATQVFFGMYAGATRMNEQRVEKIQCLH